MESASGQGRGSLSAAVEDFCPFALRHEGDMAFPGEEGRGVGMEEGGVGSGSQRMCALIPETPSGLAQLPGFPVQLP